MAPKKTPAPATKRPRGRPKGAEPMPPVTGTRIPLKLIARLDAITEARAVELAALGGTTTRSATIIRALEEYCDRYEKGTPAP